MPNNNPREDFHTVTPRMVVVDAASAVQFLRHVFDGTGEYHEDWPTEVHIGDSMMMVSADCAYRPARARPRRQWMMSVEIARAYSGETTVGPFDE
jgi:hypothetical protein